MPLPWLGWRDASSLLSKRTGETSAGVGCGHGRRSRAWLAGGKVGRGLTGLDGACSFLLSPRRACYCCPTAPASPQSRPAGLNRRTGTCRLLSFRLGLAPAPRTRFHGALE